MQKIQQYQPTTTRALRSLKSLSLFSLQLFSHQVVDPTREKMRMKIATSLLLCISAAAAAAAPSQHLPASKLLKLSLGVNSDDKTILPPLSPATRAPTTALLCSRLEQGDHASPFRSALRSSPSTITSLDTVFVSKSADAACFIIHDSSGSEFLLDAAAKHADAILLLTPLPEAAKVAQPLHDEKQNNKNGFRLTVARTTHKKLRADLLAVARRACEGGGNDLLRFSLSKDVSSPGSSWASLLLTWTTDDRNKSRCRRALTAALASHPSVRFVAPLPSVRALNGRASQLVQAGSRNAASLASTSTPIWEAGINGSGSVVGVADTGLDLDSCTVIRLLHLHPTTSSPALHLPTSFSS